MLRALWRQFESVKVLNGVLYHSFYDTNGKVLHKHLVLPRELRIPFLELVHNDVAGHLKGAKCIPHVMRMAWWFGWKADRNLLLSVVKV